MTRDGKLTRTLTRRVVRGAALATGVLVLAAFASASPASADDGRRGDRDGVRDRGDVAVERVAAREHRRGRVERRHRDRGHRHDRFDRHDRRDRRRHEARHRRADRRHDRWDRRHDGHGHGSLRFDRHRWDRRHRHRHHDTYVSVRFDAPRRLYRSSWHRYRDYYYDSVYYAPHRHRHRVYLFPYDGYYRPYAYCDGRLYGGGHIALYGRHFGIEFDF